MIEINNVRLTYGPQVVFDGIQATISTRDRIGLAGRNGAGKTTLLRGLQGQVDFDAGDIVVGRGMSLGYLPQDGLEANGIPLLQEVKSAEAHVEDLMRAMENAHARVEAHLDDPECDEAREAWETIHHLENELALREAHKLEMRAEKVLSGLGFQEKDFERDTGEFSGGWQMRIALAKLLLRQPDYLLLDEPTNHLDLPSQRWLEAYLSSYPGGLVLISHDRAFLDLLTRKTFYLRRGKLEIYQGNYSYFETEHAKRMEVLAAQKVAQERQIEKTERFINRFRAKATKATQVQSRIKQLAKVQRIELEQDEASVFFRFPPAPRCSQTLVELEAASKAYGPLTLFEDFSLKIEKEHRLAVVGVNGAGKSTLARMLAGEAELDRGERRLGQNTRLAYFAQHQTEYLDPDHSVLESAVAAGANEQQARDILGSFLFSGDAAMKPVRVLSGGEKNRLALARILLQPANFLILDEPTNHLDMASKTILQNALLEYDGAFMIISHDRDFLDPLVDRTLEINPRGHRMFWCDVSTYLEKVEAEAQAATSSVGGPSGNNGAGRDPAVDLDSINPKERRRIRAERRKQLAPLRKDVENAEARITAIDREIADWEEKMRDPAFFSNRPGQKEDMQAYESAKRRQAVAMEAWENAQLALEEAENAAE